MRISPDATRRAILLPFAAALISTSVPGAALAGWGIVEAQPNSHKVGNWRYISPKGDVRARPPKKKSNFTPCWRARIVAHTHVSLRLLFAADIA